MEQSLAEMVSTGETWAKFTGDIVTGDGLPKFNCNVEYAASLDPFLPAELRKQTDGRGYTIFIFRNGEGSFTAGSLSQAEAVEAEVRAKLKEACQEMLEMQDRIGAWACSREYDLNHPQDDAAEAGERNLFQEAVQ